jgi:hypothetical protein
MMQYLIKRLEVIKNCIVLGDDELIPNQLAKLPTTDDMRVLAIITALQDDQFSHAVRLIEDFINRNMGLMIYEDPQVAGLRLELKTLEQKILSISEEKQSIQQRMSDFHTQYHLALGELLQAVLDFNYRISYQKTLNKLKEQALIQEAITLAESKIEDLKEKIKDLKSGDLNDEQIEALSEALAELKAEQAELNDIKAQQEDFEESLEEDDDYQEYQQAKEDKETFEEELEEVIEQHQHELPEEEKNRLKKAYRKAAKLCHPDTVADEFKEQAHELMTALNVAYEQQNLAEVERILHLLETGAGFTASSDQIDNSEALKAKIAELTTKLTTLTREIERLKQDDTYQRLENLDDWDSYFNEIKVNLVEQVEQLEAEYQQILEAPPPTPATHPTQRQHLPL